MDQRQAMISRNFYDQPRNNGSLASAVNPNYQHPPPIPQAQPPQPQQPQQQQQQQQQQQRVTLQNSRGQVYSPQDAAEAQTRMEESRQRSITIVFWYKAGHEPIRLHEEIKTFPLFSLAQISQLVKDLCLGPNVYIDAYNPQAGTWEQQTITTVRQVHSEQRLLFRMRKSLLEGLKDLECAGLENEIRMQPHGLGPTSGLGMQNGNGLQQVLASPQRSLKRQMPDSATTDASPPAAKQFRTSVASATAGVGGPFAGINQQTGSVATTTPQSYQSPGTTQSPMPNPHLHQSLSPGMHPSSPFARSAGALSQPVEQQQQQSIGNAMAIDNSPPLPPGSKRWPNDYHVCEIASGLDKVDELVSQTPSVTQKAAFERVFGCRYVKSTVCRHRSVWKRADMGLREQFKRMGTVDRALWGEFVKKTGFQREGQKNNKSQSQGGADENEHERMQSQAMEYGMNGMNSLGLDMVGHHHSHALLGVAGTIGDALNGDPPMASLGPPPR